MYDNDIHILITICMHQLRLHYFLILCNDINNDCNNDNHAFIYEPTLALFPYSVPLCCYFIMTVDTCSGHTCHMNINELCRVSQCDTFHDFSDSSFANFVFCFYIHVCTLSKKKKVNTFSRSDFSY